MVPRTPAALAQVPAQSSIKRRRLATSAQAKPSSPRRRETALADPQPGRATDERALTRLTGYNVARANVRMFKEFHRHLASVHLKPAEFSALVLIANNPTINQKQLGDTLDISAPNLAVMLDQLSERGLLMRVRGEQDRRAQHPKLTREGQRLLARAEGLATEMEDKVLLLLSAAERAILIELLQKLAGRGASRP